MPESVLSINAILSPELTLCGVPGSSKKRILEIASEHLAAHRPELEQTRVFNNLVARERLGSTGIGQGIAIPHCRLDGCQSVVGALLTLEEGVSFDAIDNQPVDLLFVLVVPSEATSEHLELLSQLAEKFNDRVFCDKLRRCEDKASLYETMTLP